MGLQGPVSGTRTPPGSRATRSLDDGVAPTRRDMEEPTETARLNTPTQASAGGYGWHVQEGHTAVR